MMRVRDLISKVRDKIDPDPRGNYSALTDNVYPSYGAISTKDEKEEDLVLRENEKEIAAEVEQVEFRNDKENVNVSLRNNQTKESAMSGKSQATPVTEEKKKKGTLLHSSKQKDPLSGGFYPYRESIFGYMGFQANNIPKTFPRMDSHVDNEERSSKKFK